MSGAANVAWFRFVTMSRLATSVGRGLRVRFLVPLRQNRLHHVPHDRRRDRAAEAVVRVLADDCSATCRSSAGAKKIDQAS
jgi:hypothetical protein